MNEVNRIIPIKLLEETIGIPIDIISNEYNEVPTSFGETNTFHKVVFQLNEEEPDIYAIGILFTLSLMAFTFAGPRGYSYTEFLADEEWNLGNFVEGLRYEHGNIEFTSDYISGRLVKTDIIYEKGGKVTVATHNRGKGADRWLMHLQGKKHIQAVISNRT
jgi:hypothetical protein